MLIAYWIVAGLLAAFYLVAGIPKIVRPRARLAERMGWVEDFGAGVVKVIGILEVAGAVGVILPPLTGIAPLLAPVAAIGLALLQAVAGVVHVRRGELRQLPVNILLLLLAVAAVVLGFGALR